MSAPIALGRAGFAPVSSPPIRDLKRDMDWGDSALTAPQTPEKRLPVVDKSKVDPELLKAAQGMEAMFLDYLMQTMRHTVPKNEMDMENGATEIYRGMMDSETAQKAARAGGVGLADQIVAYMEAQRYTLPKGQSAPVTTQGTGPAHRTGGTHEGQ